MGDHRYLLEAIRDGEPRRVAATVAWLCGRQRAMRRNWSIPAARAAWRDGSNSLVTGFDVELPRVRHHAATNHRRGERSRGGVEIAAPAASARQQSRSARQLEHDAGNDAQSRRAPRPLVHIQFHSYGGDPNDSGSIDSQVEPLAEYFNSHDNLTADIGQVLFGPTTSMTGDSAVGHYLGRLYGHTWYSHDVEWEAGCGVVPIEYKDKSLVHCWQWAIGLEWLLLAADPWRIALSTDHPNGGSFLAYPQIIRLLMDRGARADALVRVHPRVRSRSVLKNLEREYSLGEICIITRAAPAKILGLAKKGRLNPGADADLTIYTPHADRQQMFELPRYVIKAGRTIVDNGELREETFGKTLHVAPSFDADREQHLADWWNDHYSVRFRNYPVDESYLGEHQEVHCD